MGGDCRWVLPGVGGLIVEGYGCLCLWFVTFGLGFCSGGFGVMLVVWACLVAFSFMAVFGGCGLVVVF